MAGPHKWWASDPGERFWLEVTRRDDIGVNLKAPQTGENGSDQWRYSIIKEIADGDIIYHYDGYTRAIVARSVATGQVWADDIIWAARGLSARSANIQPHLRPGWYLGLEDFIKLHQPITLEDIRSRSSDVRAISAALEKNFGNPLYFPFELGKRPIRPMQGYLFKMPKAFVELFALEDLVREELISRRGEEKIGEEYRAADEFQSVEARDPFATDPALVERGVRGHAATQNALAEWVRLSGSTPLSPRYGEPNFDLLWRINKTVSVAEVKSLTRSNEEKQLRLGLGQVLRYAHQLRHLGEVVPVLVAERKPSDSTWEDLCARLGVLLCWPEVFESRLARRDSVAT